MSEGTQLLGAYQAFIFCTLAQLAASAAIFTKFLFLSSSRKYWFFLGIFVVWMATNSATFWVHPTSQTYFWLYVATTPVLWILYLSAAYKLYQEVFANFPGITSLARWTVALAAASIITALVSGLLLTQNQLSPGHLYERITLVDQSLLFGLSLFCLLLLSTILRYPISIGRNLVSHCLAFSGLLLAQALVIIGNAWTAQYYILPLNNLGALFSGLCMGLWSYALTRHGDIAVVRVRRNLDPAAEFRLLRQLEAIDGILVRVGRK